MVIVNAFLYLSLDGGMPSVPGTGRLSALCSRHWMVAYHLHQALDGGMPSASGTGCGMPSVPCTGWWYTVTISLRKFFDRAWLLELLHLAGEYRSSVIYCVPGPTRLGRGAFSASYNGLVLCMSCCAHATLCTF